MRMCVLRRGVDSPLPFLPASWTSREKSEGTEAAVVLVREASDNTVAVPAGETVETADACEVCFWN